MVDQTSQFYAILTNVGAAKQANADALGIAWKITQMGVGDANGTDPTPNATQTSLLNEWRRAPLNQLKVDDKNSAIIIAEQVIPADVGGKWIREIALYDADGDMVAVANCAPTYKPLLSQGSGRTQVVRMNLVVSSASNVQLKIDPAVVLATREWVTEELARQDFKHSVLAATTVNIALSGLQTVDGVALAAGARVLVKNQTAAKDNGLYLVAAGGAWTRCTDADSSSKVTPGMLVLVERGAVNGDSAWQLVTDAAIILGISGLTYEMAFGRTGVAAGTYRSVAVDAYGRVAAATNPTTVAGYGLTDVYTKTQVDTALALRAPLASPDLTGTPTAPNGPDGDNTTRIATTSFVQKTLGLAGWGQDGQARANLVAGMNLDNIRAPGAYGQAINANATLALNYPVATAGTLLVQAASTTVTTQTYTQYNTGKTWTRAFYNTWSAWIEAASIDSPTFTGAPKAPTAAKFNSTAQLATTSFVQNALGNLPGDPVLVTSSTTLTTAQAGNLFIASNAITITLPAIASTMNGSTFHFLCTGGSVQIKGNGSEIIQGLSGGNSYRPMLGEKVSITKRNNAWYLSGGGVGSESFTSLLSASGWQKLPSGLIIQWTWYRFPVAAQDVTISLPAAFPNTHLCCFATQTDSATYSPVGYPFVAAYPSGLSTVLAQSNYTASASVIQLLSLGF
ncbi:phage tail protein [Pseudomonas sp. NPDC087029]|uniref:phage tail-collar fiber domain-containing protein n=1 Tax=Pseudomonas sp. NPDC087029 TaxID=3364433 RepID=UPI00380E2E6E